MSEHKPTQYKGFRICERCDIILCQANEADPCRGTPRQKTSVRSYIDSLRVNTAGEADIVVRAFKEENAQLRAENEKLRAEIGRLKLDYVPYHALTRKSDELAEAVGVIKNGEDLMPNWTNIPGYMEWKNEARAFLNKVKASEGTLAGLEKSKLKGEG